MDEIYCIFLGSLNNLCSLLRQYGLSKGTNEAMFIIEAYRTLRDRGPYPAHQVLKDLEGSYGFVVYDGKAGSVFAALVRSSSKLIKQKKRKRKNWDDFNCLYSYKFYNLLVCRVQMKRLTSSGVLQLMDLWLFQTT